MKIVIQKVKQASVSVSGEIVGSIAAGYLLLVGIEKGDTLKDMDKAADKIAGMRLFADDQGKINRDLHQAGGSILSVSQFTLAADVRKGNRPSFSDAMNPQEAHEMFQYFNRTLRSKDIAVETGVFQEHMNVVLDNDGPLTIILAIKDGKVL